MSDVSAAVALTRALYRYVGSSYVGDQPGAELLAELQEQGFAVVKLPDPKPDWHGGLSLWPVQQEWQDRPDQDGEVTIRKTDGRITITSVSTPFYSTVGARSLAASLLAAADAVDRLEAASRHPAGKGHTDA